MNNMRPIIPTNPTEELLVALLDEIQGLRGDLKVVAQPKAQPAVSPVSKAAADLARHKTEEKEASEDGRILQKAKMKGATPARKKPTTKKKT